MKGRIAVIGRMPKTYLAIFLALVLFIISLAGQNARANGYTLCCRNTNDCLDDSCCGCFDSGSSGCSSLGNPYTSCPSSAGGCVLGGCGDALTTTTTTVNPYSDCRILSADISSTCPVTGCRPGDVIKMHGVYSGECAEENFFQIDAVSTDSSCDINYGAGDIHGIFDFSSYCSCGSVSGVWTIHVIPNKCLGKTIVPTYAALYHGGPPGTGRMINDTRDVSGSVKLAQCVCDEWTPLGCGQGGCLQDQSLKQRTCDPNGCSINSVCVDPDFGTQSLGCGNLCGPAGQCAPDEDCRLSSDSNGCAKEKYECVQSAGCGVACDGSKDLRIPMFYGWNSISLPCTSMRIVTDGCGVSYGNFYFYDGNTGKWNVSTVGLDTLQSGVGYWFFSSRACSVVLRASGGARPILLADISINSGWNQVAGPTGGLDDAKDSLSTCKDCADGRCSVVKVLQYDTLGSKWEDVNRLSPTYGYSVQCID
jgi:hypothetical protein